MEDDNGIVTEDVCEDIMQDLGGGLVLMLLRTGILFGKVVVVSVGVMAIMAVGVMFFQKNIVCQWQRCK